MSGDTGAVTVEAAFAIAALVSVLVVCLAGLNAAVLQIRCVDAAREAARLAARGDDGVAAARRVGPAGAVVSVHREGDLLVARISTKSALLPGITIAAEAVSVAEQGR
ncbi:TadE family type IV pilus minor pilin [Mycolicibacterium frederiksbergense]|uniref:TadE family type IV pilus minor pilin n=1 Tax=Mycolicibacterium frederiksbergense TaxID=117567 RepID=UPI00399AD9E9